MLTFSVPWARLTKTYWPDEHVTAEQFDNVEEIGWLGIGFVLGSGLATLPIGKAFGIEDTKWLYVGCLLNFSAASALCCGAPNMKALIIGRVWAGVGVAGIYVGTL